MEQEPPFVDPAPAPSSHGNPPAPGPGVPAELTTDDRNFAMLGHLLGAFTSFVGPLAVWLLKKDESAFADEEAKESLNFQITLLIAYSVLGVATCATFGIAGILIPVLMIVGLVFPILGALKAKDGLPYRYPFTLRLVK